MYLFPSAKSVIYSAHLLSGHTPAAFLDLPFLELLLARPKLVAVMISRVEVCLSSPGCTPELLLSAYEHNREILDTLHELSIQN
jgi:hypothetical protein